MQQYFNYHTHTYRCKHAKGSDEEYVLAAIKAGYRILGFSDHAPYKDFPSDTSRMDWHMLEDYIDSIKILKEKYKGQIEIKLGLESEYYAFNHEERKQLHDMVDYLLLGQHFKGPRYTDISYFKNNTDEDILDYGKSVIAGLDTGMFTYLCHPDVFMSHQNQFSKACEEVAHMIGQKCSEKNIPVELNVHALRKGRYSFGDNERYYYPHYEFWKILAEYPVRVVIGVDAHDPKDLLRLEDVDSALAEVQDLNLNFIKEPFI